MTRIPNCCAMPLDSKVGDTYVCLTCGTTYRHLIGGWALAGPIVDLAPELQAPDPIDCTCRIGVPQHDGPCSCHMPECPLWKPNPYEITLDTNERTGH